MSLGFVTGKHLARLAAGESDAALLPPVRA
jgi:hypothetical protein